VSDRTYLNDLARDMLLNSVSSGAVLEAGGSSLAKAVKVNVFLANMDDFAAVNEVYAKFFPDPKPVSIISHFEIINFVKINPSMFRSARVLPSRLCRATPTSRLSALDIFRSARLVAQS
jgi:hypothetical protein